MNAAEGSVVTSSVLWTRLPPSLDNLPPQPAVTQALIASFRQQLKTFDLADFMNRPLPRYRTTAEMVEPILKFDADQYWREMLADRYGEHQPPDLPSYRWSAENRPGFRAYAGSLRPFNARLMFAVVAARFDPAGPWFNAVAGRSGEFAEWARSDECTVWAGSYDVSDIVENFANFFDLCVDRLSPQQKADFLDGTAAMMHKLRALIDLFKPHKYPRDSHVFRMTCTYASLGVILHAHGRKEGTQALQYWKGLMAPAFPGFGGEDGGWSQGTAYWKWKLSPVCNLAEPMRDLGFADLLAKPFIQNTGYFKWYVQPPHARTGAFGDHPNLRAEPLDLAMVRLLGVMLKREDLIAYADQYEPQRGPELAGVAGNVDLVALLLLLKTWDVPTDRKRPAPAGQSRIFRDQGIVASHTALGDAGQDVMVLFRSSPGGSFNHAHADQNSFIVEAFGEPVFIDGGYYPSYHHPHMKGFAIQTMAHNALLLNNQGQSIRNLLSRGTIEHYESDADHDYTIGECAAAYPSNPKLVRRHVWFQRATPYPWMLVVDHVILRQPGTVDFLLQTYEKPTWDSQRREAIFRGWQLWGGQARARVQFLQPTAWYWEATDQFPYPADGREATQVPQWRTKATTADPTYEHWLVTAISFSRGKDEPARMTLSETGGVASVSSTELCLTIDPIADHLRRL